MKLFSDWIPFLTYVPSRVESPSPNIASSFSILEVNIIYSVFLSLISDNFITTIGVSSLRQRLNNHSWYRFLKLNTLLYHQHNLTILTFVLELAITNITGAEIEARWT